MTKHRCLADRVSIGLPGGGLTIVRDDVVDLDALVGSTGESLRALLGDYVSVFAAVDAPPTPSAPASPSPARTRTTLDGQKD